MASPAKASTTDPGGPSPGSGGGVGEGNPACRDHPIACQGATGVVPGQSAIDTVGAVGADRSCIRRTATVGSGDVQSDSVPYCTIDTTGDGIADAIAAPPPPPTHPEIVATVCPSPPPPAIGHNPREFGITGMATWLWDASAPTTLSASGSIRGYPVTCTVTPTTWTFDTGDPHAARFGHARTHTSGEPGREDEATPVQHLWEVAGTYPLTLEVTWQRTTTAGADQLTRTTRMDHPVRQVRAAMTTPSDR